MFHGISIDLLTSFVSSSQVWDSRKRTIIQDFRNHQFGVQSCAFSPDETLVLSADVDSVVMVSKKISSGIIVKSEMTCFTHTHTHTQNNRDTYIHINTHTHRQIDQYPQQSPTRKERVMLESLFL